VVGVPAMIAVTVALVSTMLCVVDVDCVVDMV
jgi:hypothetical protein